MLVTLQRFGDIKSLKVPQLYGQVGRARGQNVSIRVKCEESNHASVRLERALVLTLLKVPKANAGIFASCCSQVVEGMNRNLGYL